ncbi:hypothetical protein [Ornithobacterium rhinotracheale]|uniref:hypothetical protein n=1 Tax=Ornithobacterium rhinotracheale TaxID=28251 RepID=UPI001FF4A3E2|nr:hypothetical protein [Ornithobacterium rhinotracheale]MCK0206193.1 hypothetical protein [Ornithobacterium rhinotracheale]
MEKFAIIHETTKHGQILIEKISNADALYVKVAFLVKGAAVEIKINADNQNALNEIFKSYGSAETAIKTVDNIKKEYNL